MAIDILYNTDLDTEWNGVGDIKRSSGPKQVRQSIGISVLEFTDLSAPSFDPGDIEEKRASIEDAVRRNPLSQEPIRVRVSEREPTEQRIEFTIVTRRVELPITAE
jgi:hypothetical protein